MATAEHLTLSATENPGYIHAEEVSQATADKVSELLMKNHEKFHIFFNARGLHSEFLFFFWFHLDLFW
jgi:hypothetical protein